MALLDGVVDRGEPKICNFANELRFSQIHTAQENKLRLLVHCFELRVIREVEQDVAEL